jgi:TolB-like protein/Tfp pilus assembly protein PilF
VKLERIPFELLTFLLERRGQLVGRDDIAARLWGSAVHVDVESGVNTAIRKLRTALRDSPDKPSFIETVPGKGYRFIADVTSGDLPVAVPLPHRSKLVRRASGLAAALAVAAAVVYHTSGWADAPPVPSTPVTVIVLPFQNLSSDPEQEYLGDGLTEETIAALGRVSPSRMRVIARTSSMAYKGTRKTAKQIGEELGATYLLESSVRRDPQRVRITAKLIRALDQVQVWSAHYDRAPVSSLGIQDEIGNAIARQIGAELSGPNEQAKTRLTQDPDSHDLYLRGRYYLYQRTPDSMRKSAECFEGAIQKDPSYALAYAGLAENYVLQTIISGANPLGQRTKARLTIEKALSLDPNLAEAQTAAGMVNFFVVWDWAAAERSFKRAIEINPNYATAHQFYGHLLSNWLRHEEAITEIQRARELDPLSPMMHTFAGGYLVLAKRYGEALAPLQHALSTDPNFFPTHSVLGMLYHQTGKPDDAIAEFRKAYHLSGGNIVQLAYQGFVLGQVGRLAEARQIIGTMNQISQSPFVPPFAFALVHTGLGERDAAFRWLEKAYELRDFGLVFLASDPKWDSLRSDKRFQNLMRRCRFL